MKVLGIVGSKRKKGNTSILVQSALRKAEAEGMQTDLIFLGDHSIAGCTGCEGCKDTYRCVIDDDMQKIYPLLLEADAIILGSPTYFYNVTADVKAFIDRCYCFVTFADDDRSVWVSINEAQGGKFATVIAVCEQYSEADMRYTPEAMALPLEALGYRVIDKVKVLKLFAAGEARQDKISLEQAAKAGERLAKTLKLKQETKQR
ncbi:flavodoxin family protein [Dethiobacter alkaliphilus]|uniref:NADPH-dependent FMN reductase n=1 Tax=Dethiobacter alkaliphilus AHT 1 TaxID=555088 RepID=C0GDB6_DETAL|nr:flavodoxin family protein [Dethiobacter alkaliphilus]EEG78637.1 NADPH-dependent FMN reductase [Dethiobacter alkaliphilus AHT 1]